MCFCLSACKKRLCCISTRAGCNAHAEPSNTSVGVAGAGRQGACADIDVTLLPPHGPTSLNIYISTIQPRCATYVAAASLRDRDKYQDMPAICTLAILLHLPASRRTGPSAGPSCGTIVPSATSRRHALWLSPWDRSLLVPTGN
jgi:hypothetical protein